MVRVWMSLLTALIASVSGGWVLQAPTGAVHPGGPAHQQRVASPASSTSASEHSSAPRAATQRGAARETEAPSRSRAGTRPARDTSPPSAPPATAPLAPELYAVGAGEVALTIDDGPSPYTERILATLRRFHVHATFFFIGNRVAEWPDAVREAAADGNVIGDHSVDHRDLTKLSPAGQQWEVVEGARLIQQVVPQPIRLFRPPYEALPGGLRQLLGQQHMALALWNRDPRDWAASTPEQVVRQVVDDHPSGGVFDLHETAATAAALPVIIQTLEQRGLRFVTLTPPASAEGIPPAGKTPLTSPPVPAAPTGTARMKSPPAPRR
ncbi:MAG: polysaccharide deacetylase family protein [Alicyclobacillaceae bacterium]|nr:polysaccharide deacetylase family protein [Alicyclobacillaceae bacterium]